MRELRNRTSQVSDAVRAGRALREATGTNTVAGNVTRALIDLFGPVTVAIVGLIISRDGLRTRLRQARSAGIPLVGEGTAMIASYLSGERDLGRIAADTEVETLAPTLIGAGHLLFADRENGPPDPGGVHKVVTAVVGSVLQEPPLHAPSLG